MEAATGPLCPPLVLDWPCVARRYLWHEDEGCAERSLKDWAQYAGRAIELFTWACVLSTMRKQRIYLGVIAIRAALGVISAVASYRLVQLVWLEQHGNCNYVPCTNEDTTFRTLFSSRWPSSEWSRSVARSRGGNTPKLTPAMFRRIEAMNVAP
jgi:hypothetical protein